MISWAIIHASALCDRGSTIASNRRAVTRYRASLLDGKTLVEVARLLLPPFQVSGKCLVDCLGRLSRDHDSGRFSACRAEVQYNRVAAVDAFDPREAACRDDHVNLTSIFRHTNAPS